MVRFHLDAHRFDPYGNFKFHIVMDGKVVAGVSKISALKRSAMPVMHRQGRELPVSRSSPGAWKFAPITLERGITHDPAFENWANLCYNATGEAAMSLENFRKDIVIHLLNEQGSVVRAFKVYRCWVSAYSGLPGLDANGDTVAIESMVLQNEGWERDSGGEESTEM